LGHVLEVVQLKYEKAVGKECVYSVHAQPKLVDDTLRPFCAFFVCPEVMPGMSATIVDQKPPTGIVSKWLIRGVGNI
jgi:hypothetical protein